MAKAETADLVVVGAGMVGGWASWFAAGSGADRVIVLEKDLAGQGASSRAAGVVRAQGGTPDHGRARPVLDRLLPLATGRHRDGLRVPRARLPDPRGDAAGCARGNARVEMQRTAGLDVRWVDAGGVRAQPDPRGRGTSRRSSARRTARSILRGTCARTRSPCNGRACCCASGRRSSDCERRPRAADADASPAWRRPTESSRRSA